MKVERRGALISFGAAVLAVALGAFLAARHYPGGFDWVYTVVSRLASPRRNPEGAPWLAGFFLLAMLFLWPVAGYLGRGPGRGDSLRRASVVALRAGLVGGMVLGVEGLFSLDFTRVARKGHELVALAASFGFFAGVVGLYLHRIRKGHWNRGGRRTRNGSSSHPWMAVLVPLPLIAAGLSQLALYLSQSELGWVDASWRELGVPFYLSFAFWQWLAVAFLALGIGHLVVTRERGRRDPPSTAMR